MPRDRFVVGVPLGRWQTNCFVVGDRDAGTAVVIDPGETGAQAVPGILADNGVRCEAILLTHGHLDHMWAVPELADKLDVPVHLHPGDRWLWDNPISGFGQFPAEAAGQLLEQQFGLVWDNSADRLLDVDDHDTLTYSGIDFGVRHNPGHTPGHVTFLADDLEDAEVAFALSAAESDGPVLFSGDLIFAGSVGRTDFPRGSTDDLLRSLVDTVLPLEDRTIILSGHGPHTTVGRERATNPFVQQALRRAS